MLFSLHNNHPYHTRYITASHLSELESLWQTSHRELRGLPPPRTRRGHTLKVDSVTPRVPIKLPAQPSTDFDWFGRDPAVAQSPVLRVPAEVLPSLRYNTLSQEYFDCAVLLARCRYYAPDFLSLGSSPPPEELLPALSRWRAMVEGLPAPDTDPVISKNESTLLSEWLPLIERIQPHLCRMERP